MKVPSSGGPDQKGYGYRLKDDVTILRQLTRRFTDAYQERAVSALSVIALTPWIGTMRQAKWNDGKLEPHRGTGRWECVNTK